MVVVQGVWLSGTGLAFGLAGGLAFGRLLGNVLYGVAPNDPQAMTAVVGLLMIIAMAACYMPARHATRPDLTTLLRPLRPSRNERSHHERAVEIRRGVRDWMYGVRRARRYPRASRLGWV